MLRDRPADIPSTCGKKFRGSNKRCGGLVLLYENEHKEKEWRCSICEKVYKTQEERWAEFDANHEAIFRCRIENGRKGFILVTRSFQISPTELKLLIEKYPDAYKEIEDTEKRRLDKLRSDAKEKAGVKRDNEVGTIQKELAKAGHKLNVPSAVSGTNNNHPCLPTFSNDWTEAVQLRWFESYDKIDKVEVKSK